MEDLFDNSEVEKIVIEEADNKDDLIEKEPEADKKKERADFFKAKKEIEAQKTSLLEENKKLKAMTQGYQKVVKELGYNGEVGDIEIELEAEKSGKSIEEIKKQKKVKEEEIARLAEAKAEELVASKLEKKEMERLVSEDFTAIRAKYPDGQIKEDKLQAFAVLRSNGIDALQAFEILEKPTVKENKKTVSTGSTEALGGIEKDFYTRAEVLKMNENEIQKNFSKIEKSMKKW